MKSAEKDELYYKLLFDILEFWFLEYTLITQIHAVIEKSKNYLRRMTFWQNKYDCNRQLYIKFKT